VDAVEQVLVAEREWLLAHQHLDIPALERLMDSAYLQIDAGGAALDKEQTLASCERHWDEAHSDEHHVRVYGNTGFVVGRWRARGENAARPFDYQARYVSVWVLRAGEWRMVSDQSTPITWQAVP
jgi:ketosteroid isomerase-like protein